MTISEYRAFSICFTPQAIPLNCKQIEQNRAANNCSNNLVIFLTRGLYAFCFYIELQFCEAEIISIMIKIHIRHRRIEQKFKKANEVRVVTREIEDSLKLQEV